MKRLIAIILILALAVPAAALADDRDPIVRAWYMYYNKLDAPEMESAFKGIDQQSCIYFFYEDGIIYISSIAISAKDGTPGYLSCGKWEKVNGKYNVSIMGIGQGDALIEGDNLLVNIQDNYYFILHKLIPINPFTDYVTR